MGIRTLLVGWQTWAEAQLLRAVVQGDYLDFLRPDERTQNVTEITMRGWSTPRTVRASFIEDILRGRLAKGAVAPGVRLRGAKIVGRLNLDGMDTKVGLELDTCYLPNGMSARVARLRTLVLARCVVRSLFSPDNEAWTDAPAVDADELITNLIGIEAASVEAHSRRAAISLRGAQLGSLNCGGATVTNFAGPALQAAGFRVKRSVMLHDGFNARGSTEDGTINMLGARIDGTLYCEKAKLTTESGVAISADGMEVRQIFVLKEANIEREGGVAASKKGVVDLRNAHLGGLDCEGATLPRNDDTVIDLRNTRINGVLKLDIGTNPVHRVAWDGVTYHSWLSSREGVSARAELRDRLSCLQSDPDRYRPGPYQQLAAYYQAIGDNKSAREVLVTQQRERGKTLRKRNPARWWNWFEWSVTGYGYRFWKSLIAILILIALGVAYFYKNHPQPSTNGNQNFNPIAYTVDVALPIVPLGQETMPVGLGICAGGGLAA